MQGKTEKKMKKNPHQLHTRPLKRKRNSMEFALKPRVTAEEADKATHNCISQIMLKSKGSANISHGEAPVGNHKKPRV